MENEKVQTMQSTETTTNESLVSETVASLKGIPTKEDLEKILREELVEVTFLKLDGDKRVMTCTLMDSIKPVVENKESSKTRKTSDKTCSVWDINAKGWRSFRYDRVQEVKIKSPEDVQ